jgi:hypothetical protein
MFQGPNGMKWSQYIVSRPLVSEKADKQPDKQISLNQNETSKQSQTLSPLALQSIPFSPKTRPHTSPSKLRRSNLPPPVLSRSRLRTRSPANIRTASAPSSLGGDDKKIRRKTNKMTIKEWKRGKNLQTKMEKMKRRKQLKLEKQKTQNKENAKERRWDQLREKKKKQSKSTNNISDRSTSKAINSSLTIINERKRSQQKEMLQNQLKLAKIQEWMIQKDLEKAQNERKMEEQKRHLEKLKKKRREEKWKLKTVLLSYGLRT